MCQLDDNRGGHNPGQLRPAKVRGKEYQQRTKSFTTGVQQMA